mmetsp:Transcript_13136/g.15441  ORF Transcript_13136/g.15441 Transcript_13136/m.15441 type:complete len:307 (+) Transcript_13136:222-1142(+)|eukprot:CAMPEP_0198265982 /NCGR_PEP_ID=MMETSP1447-20131203/25836_1 /TAXON_ID=420782 /ORGANISM="Chaetoceros dichaeta, Strain CCMP1751" /LENGTH=306 /DNA_ID=CAMNT_0043955795 /DNA_START=163 /DNA_END=1083 /DNA_ORIENTATION=-
MPLFANVIIAVALQTAVVLVQGATLSACFDKYPGYAGNIDASGGSKVQIRFNELFPGLMLVKFRGKGIERNCVNCGVHIHSGTSCADHDLVGGHYWDTLQTTNDPWTTESGAVYNTDSEGMSNDDYVQEFGYDLDGNLGHAVVVHAQDGKRIGCGVLSKSKEAAKSCKAKKTVLRTCITPYPHYEGVLSVNGGVKVVFKRDQMNFKYKLEGADIKCNGCGIHIHSGTKCDDVGGHYWDDENGSIVDPWDYSGGYTPSGGYASGSFTVKSGYSGQENIGHAVVVHDSNNKPYGCGVLSTTANATICA